MSETPTTQVRRRHLLRTIGTGAVIGVAGLSTMTGSAAAWERQDADFKGCSEVWLIVGADDVSYDPPVVARVVVALGDGTTECRDVEFRTDNTAPIPGQYGHAPVRKVRANDGEKVLGVVFYNYRDDRFSSPSCIFVNDHRCANTPNTPSFESAECVEHARANDGYDCSVRAGPGKKGSPPSRNRRGRGRRGPSKPE